MPCRSGRPCRVGIAEGHAIDGVVGSSLGFAQVGRLCIARRLQGGTFGAGHGGRHPSGIGGAAQGVVFGKEPPRARQVAERRERRPCSDDAV
ncbi:hypothetical protein D9M72_383140 [compost metagenome]